MAVLRIILIMHAQAGQFAQLCGQCFGGIGRHGGHGAVAGFDALLLLWVLRGFALGFAAFLQPQLCTGLKWQRPSERLLCLLQKQAALPPQ